MKNSKIIAATLAVCIAMTSLVACDSDSTKETKSTKKAKEETEAETTLAEIEVDETSVEDSDVEPAETKPEETEPEIDLTLYQEGSFYDLTNHPESSNRYDKIREIVQMIHDEYPDVTMYYGILLEGDAISVYFCDVGWGSESLDSGYSPWKWYTYNFKTDELSYFDDEEEWMFPCVSYTYEEFMKYPILPSDNHYLGKVGPLYWEDSVPDGEYFATIKAISLDGTKMLALVQEPVTLTPEEYYNLKPGDIVSAPYVDPRFDYDLTVSSKFDIENPETIFDSCGYHFEEREDGNFLLVADNLEIPIAPSCYNSRLVILDVAPDCEIDDSDFVENYSETTAFGYYDGPNSLTRSYYFYHYTGRVQLERIYNDWSPVGGTATPIFIENNAVVKMTVY